MNEPKVVTYEILWRNKWLTCDCKTLPEMVETLRAAASQLEEYHNGGVVLDPDSGIGDDYASLITTDSAIAEKFKMEKYFDEEEWDDDDDAYVDEEDDIV